MAEYKGYLLKINGTELPGQYIQDYSSTPNQAQDKDSYQDLTGELHREILAAYAVKNRIQNPADVSGRKNCFSILFSGSKKQSENIS